MKRRPLVEEVRSPVTAAEAFARFGDEPMSFFLDGGMDPAKPGRYSFIGLDPFLVLRFRGDETTGCPFALLGSLMEQYRLEPDGAPTPLAGGAVGYPGYDLCRSIRTITVKGDRVYLQVGGGIVHDSDPEAEYRETLHKAEAAFRALGAPPPGAAGS